MLWILITVLVGLVVVIVQLLLSYQRRAVRLKVAQNPIRKQMNDYKDKITEVGEGVRIMANDSLGQLKKDLATFERRSGLAANFTAELDPEAQAWVAAREGLEGAVEPDPLLDEEQDEDAHEESSANGHEDDVDIDELLGGRKEAIHKVDSNRANPVEIVRAIRHELEETYEYIESLRTDAGLVQQSLQWLGEDKNKGKDGANGSA